MNVEQSEEVLGEKAAAIKRFPLHWVLLALVAIAIFASFYTYLFAKNYDFLIEIPCSTGFQECYTRDCSTDDCPPNNLSAYSMYRIPARLFDSCTNNGCVNLCGNGSADCENIPCSSQTDIECGGPTFAQ